MKLIIAGSRDLEVTIGFIRGALDTLNIKPTEIISGVAQGIDTCGENFALTEDILISQFPADWNAHGKAAGHIRNKEMAHYADALLLIWDGESKGSANMKQNMLSLGKPIYEIILK